MVQKSKIMVVRNIFKVANLYRSLRPISLHVGWVEPKRNPSLLMRFVPQRILPMYKTDRW